MTTLKRYWLMSLVCLTGCALDPSGGAAASSASLRADESESEDCDRRGHPVPVVFDTDMDFDDAAALAYLCQQHVQGNIDLLAVTVNNDGAGTPGHAIRHARCILAEAGLPEIPVADGSDEGVNPVAPELRFAVDAVLEGAFASCDESTDSSDISAPDSDRTDLAQLA